MDIVKAMALEESYIEHRMRDKEPFHLVDAVKECGFESIDEYFMAKKAYFFSRLDFELVEETMPNGVAEIFKMIQMNHAGVLFVDWNETYVVCANRGLEEFNRQYCEKNNITFFPLHTPGGTIVGSTGDFSFGVCVPDNINVDTPFILNGVKDILQKHTEKEVSINGNDILVDEKKICGSANYKGEGVLMVIMHFSFSDWSELITNICTTSKIGKEVSHIDFMTKAEFKQEVSKWLRVHSI